MSWHKTVPSESTSFGGACKSVDVVLDNAMTTMSCCTEMVLHATRISGGEIQKDLWLVDSGADYNSI